MSVLDHLRAAQQRVTDRLAELEPLVKEYEELRAAADKLNPTAPALTPGTTTTAPRRKPGKRRTATKPASATKRPTAAKSDATTSAATTTPPKTRKAGVSRERPGQRSSDRATAVRRLVQQHPGITVAELGKELNVDPTSLYRPIKKLVQQGHLAKDGRQLQPK